MGNSSCGKFSSEIFSQNLSRRRLWNSVDEVDPVQSLVKHHLEAERKKEKKKHFHYSTTHSIKMHIC